MKLGGRRFLRFTVAATLVGVVASQIPTNELAIAASKPNYNTSTGSSGSTIRKLGAGAAVLFLAAGVYSTIADAGAGVTTATAPAAGPPGSRTIYDVIKGDPTDYKTLGTDVDNAQMEKTYRNDGPYTVFAPDESAFGKLTPDQVGGLTGEANLPKLQALLSYHTVKGRYDMADLKALPDGTKLVTLAGTVLTVNTTGGTVSVNGVPVVDSDQVASNGYVHTIQTVLMPPAPDAAPAATTPAAPTTPAQ
jgi:uncharacterized surface protein with fasciclin (FAS1) repeats